MIEKAIEKLPMTMSPQRCFPSAHKADPTQNDIHVPVFDLVCQRKGFEAVDRLVTDQIDMHVNKEYGMYMKELMAMTTIKFPGISTFVPARCHCMTTINTYKNVIQKNSKHIEK